MHAQNPELPIGLFFFPPFKPNHSWMENAINVSSDTREAAKPTIVPDSLFLNYNFQLENDKNNAETKTYKAGTSLHILSAPCYKIKVWYY